MCRPYRNIPALLSLQSNARPPLPRTSLFAQTKFELSLPSISMQLSASQLSKSITFVAEKKLPSPFSKSSSLCGSLNSFIVSVEFKQSPEASPILAHSPIPQEFECRLGFGKNAMNRQKQAEKQLIDANQVERDCCRAELMCRNPGSKAH